LSETAGITFQDLIVHVERLTPSLLFHELLHAVQHKHLGLERFAERYVLGYLDRGSYEEIPPKKNRLMNSKIGFAPIRKAISRSTTT